MLNQSIRLKMVQVKITAGVDDDLFDNGSTEMNPDIRPIGLYWR